MINVSKSDLIKFNNKSKALLKFDITDMISKKSLSKEQLIAILKYIDSI